MLENSADTPLLFEESEHIDYSLDNCSWSGCETKFDKKENLKNINHSKSVEHSKKKGKRKKIELEDISSPKNNTSVQKINQTIFAVKKSGFENLGNSCYMNSFLQILIHTPNFIEELVKIKETKNDLINNLIDLSKGQNKVNNLKNIKKIMGEKDKSYSQYCQNDSQQFGMDLIDNLIAIIKKEKKENESSDKENNFKKSVQNINEFNKKKLLCFQDFKNKEIKNEISLEKMFVFYEFQAEINNESIKLKRIPFELQMNVIINLSDETNKDYDLIGLLNDKYYKGNYIEPIKNEAEKPQPEIIIEKELPIEEPSNSEIPEQKNNSCCKIFWKCFISYICACLICIDNSILSICNCIYLYLILPLLCCCKNEKENNIINLEESNNENYFHIKKIINPPKILIITINRAIINHPFNISKLNFKESLNIKEYLDNDFSGESNQKTEYSLYAINECVGNSRESGHYYSYINIKNRWFIFDDEKLNEQTPSFDSQYVVGLFYIRKE